MNRTEPRDAFALEALDGGGVLLDLRSGQVRVLNHTAAFVWEQHLRGFNDEQVVEAFARVFGVGRDLARRDVSTCLVIQDQPLPHPPPAPGTPNYRRSADGYRLHLGETPLLEVSRGGDAVRALTALPPRELQSYLRVLSPKLAALRGFFVLHAAAIRRPRGDVVAFAGASEAGKTTTAQLFARAGNELISEDKLLLRREGDRLVTVLQGERALGSFMTALQTRLTAGPMARWAEIETRFDDVVSGQAAVLAEVSLLSAERRAGSEIALVPVAPAQAAARLFENVFVGSEDPEEWTRDLGACARVARTTRIALATMPAGLPALEAAARRYTAMTAS